VTIGVGKAEGHKCARCWNYSEEVGKDAEHPELCERCAPVVKEAGFPAQPAKLAETAAI
jgi:isoleucyl-tRNA synthetase